MDKMFKQLPVTLSKGGENWHRQGVIYCFGCFSLVEKLPQYFLVNHNGIIIIFDSHLKTVPSLPLYIYKPKCFYIVSFKLNLKDQISFGLVCYLPS